MNVSTQEKNMDVPPSGGGGGKSDHVDENKREKLEANKHKLCEQKQVYQAGFKR